MPSATEARDGARLELVREPSGLRHFLAGKPVHAGYILELQLEDGWIRGRYEWSFQEGTLPLFYVALASGTGVVSFHPPEAARFRWPGER